MAPRTEITQSWSAEGYARHASFVPELGSPLIEFLQPRAGEKILDLGCGDGVLTARLAESGAVVTGVDSSESMAEAAKQRGLTVRVMNCQALDFDGEFDAAFSNAALHWMLDPDAVLNGVARALKPGGRFVGEFGGFANVGAIMAAWFAMMDAYGIEARSPWYFPNVDEYRSKLESHSFEVQSITLIPRPTPLPTGMEGWLETFGLPLTNQFPATHRETARARMIAALRRVLCDSSGNWIADYVRLRFSAVLAPPTEE